MAHLDLHEQEQVAKVKYFWRDWGKYIALLVVILIIAYIASVAWNWHNKQQALKAANIYNEFTTSITAKDKTKVYALANELEQQYPKVEYTVMANLSAAKIAVDNKDQDKAIEFLNWNIQNAKDKGLVAMSRLNLANIYIDKQKFDMAMDVLKANQNTAFDALFYSARGDLYIAKGDNDKARDAYKEALKRAGDDASITQTVQMKIDLLGG